MPYFPSKPPPTTTDDGTALSFYLEDELSRLASSVLDDVLAVEMRPAHSAPIRPRAGMLAYADGVDWNPGTGEGLYQYSIGASWQKLIHDNGPGSEGIELGFPSVAGTPYIDFHSSGNVVDYDARIVCTGGTATQGQGELSISANILKLEFGNAALGALLQLVGNGATTPSKYIRAFGGNLEVVNNAFSVVIASLSDAGALSTAGAIAAIGGITSTGGNITAVNGDMQTYRVGGTTGVIFLNSASTRYLFFDGTSYQMPGSALVLGGGLAASGSIQCTGHVTRTGVSGAFGGNAYNLWWNGASTELYIDNTNTGVITVVSDYRIKKDVIDAAPALAEVLQWRPITYTGKAWGIFEENNNVRHSFIAHELQAISPDCVTGEKDGEQPQGLDLVPIVVRLAKAVQELSAELSILKARVEAIA